MLVLSYLANALAMYAWLSFTNLSPYASISNMQLKKYFGSFSINAVAGTFATKNKY